jgi:hypothetical protein
MKSTKQKKIELAIMLSILLIDLILFMDLKLHAAINTILNNLEIIFVSMF